MRRSVIVSAAVAALFLAAGTASADCTRPGPAPAPPRGAVDSLEDMKLAHSAMQTFVDALEAYQVCLEKQIKDAPPDTKEELKLAWRAQGNAAIDLAHQAAQVYSNQYQIFKTLHPEATAQAAAAAPAKPATKPAAKPPAAKPAPTPPSTN